MNEMIPVKPDNSFRVTISLDWGAARLDGILLNELKRQNENTKLKNISRAALKTMFSEKKISIKGQNARPASSLAKGITYVDILDV
jgi:hypothetical protein